MTLIVSFMTLQKPGEGSRRENDEVLYYFKEVVILGPVHFISHWTWTIAFYVFLFPICQDLISVPIIIMYIYFLPSKVK